MVIDVNKLLATGNMLRSKGVEYKLGAKAVPPSIPAKLDCSGFVRYCYLSVGAKVPDGTYYQFGASTEVTKLQIGDIGFLQLPTDKGTNHIGIYAGGGKWMHCSYSNNAIKTEKTSIFKHYRRFNGITYTKGEKEPMAKFEITDKELQYGISAINRLAELKMLTSPERHIETLKQYPFMWSQWVMQVKNAEK